MVSKPVVIMGAGAAALLLLSLASKKTASAAPLPTGNAGGPPGPAPGVPFVPGVPGVPSAAPSGPTNAGLAVAVAANIRAAVASTGGNVAAAKGREDRALVARFQAAEGLVADGMYGPKTREALARYVNNPPGAMYFPKAPAGRETRRFGAR